MTQRFGEADKLTWVHKAFLNHVLTVAIGEAEIMSGKPAPILLVVLFPSPFLGLLELPYSWDGSSLMHGLQISGTNPQPGIYRT